MSGLWHPGSATILGVHQGYENLLRDGILLGLAALSWLTTSKALRRDNEYSWGPIREVAILFAGIFATMIPALLMLGAGEHGALAFIIRAVNTPAQFFWATGSLSSFLDNAPTYLTFLQTALGRLFPGIPEREAIARLIAETPAFLRAVSIGAVFMGAMTYIGNAPELHGQVHCRGGGRQDALVLRLHGALLPPLPDPDLPADNSHLLLGACDMARWLKIVVKGDERTLRGFLVGFGAAAGRRHQGAVLGSDVPVAPESLTQRVQQLLAAGFSPCRPGAGKLRRAVDGSDREARRRRRAGGREQRRGGGGAASSFAPRPSARKAAP